MGSTQHSSKLGLNNTLAFFSVFYYASFPGFGMLGLWDFSCCEALKISRSPYLETIHYKEA
jgi:hypothetical protein